MLQNEKEPKIPDYIKTFQLSDRTEINEFIFDFIDFNKILRNLNVELPLKIIDYVATFKLDNTNLINKFIDDFCQQDKIEIAIKTKQRIHWIVTGKHHR